MNNTMEAKVAPAVLRGAIRPQGKVNNKTEVVRTSHPPPVSITEEAFQFQTVSSTWSAVAPSTRTWWTTSIKGSSWVKDFPQHLPQTVNNLWIPPVHTIFQIPKISNYFYNAKRTRGNFKTRWSIATVGLDRTYHLATRVEEGETTRQLLTPIKYKTNINTKETRLILESVGQVTFTIPTPQRRPPGINVKIFKPI